jgi:23S rRNA (uracil1939-C5)-methyltransferase
MRPNETAMVTIESVGMRGDGIAKHEGAPVYVPFTAPGDRARVAIGPSRGEGRAGRLVELLAPGERAAPSCPHFGHCGGCALQHLSEGAYRAAKEGWLRSALAQHGIGDETVAPLRRLPPGTRRRARFALHRPREARASARIGFHARASHEVVDMRACAVLHPGLVALVEPLRRLASTLWPPAGKGAATATMVDNGVDLLLDLARPPDLAALEALAGFAETQDLARLAWRVPGMEDAMPVALRRPVGVVLGGVAVDLPADAFLQASAEADAALTQAVLAGVGASRRVADLFAGIGTFSFALAQGAQVHAVEGWAPAVAALAAAARAGLSGRVTAERRDLERQPLLGEELAAFDAVVLDPPRAGAKAQSAALAQAAVPRVVMVSCNPATFARDARLLVDGGYRLAAVEPFDAFVWSPHLELVARFDRA